MTRRVSGLTIESGRYIAIAFAVLLVTSVAVGPVAATGFSESGVTATGATGLSGSSSALGADTGLEAGTSIAQTDETNETDDNQTDVRTIGGHQPQDVDGDGRYEDVDGDGSLGQGDVTLFFRYQHRDEMKRPKLFDFSGNGRVTHGDVVTLFDAVAIGGHVIDHRWPPDADGDGLPTAFEEDVLGTDPNDPDSNSMFTARNESGNNVSDADEDFSGNGLPAIVAYDRGLDPFANDTDDDGLPDTVEVQYSMYNGSEADTDGDGTPDAAEDPDGDGLDNVAEFEHGTILTDADSDGDGLDDGREVELGTDPLDADSDDDGLPDAEEVEFETDPLVADSDGDGTLDGNETLERTVEDEDTGVSLEVSGEGGADADVSEHDSALDDADVTAGPTVAVENRSGVENATVSIPIDEDVASKKDVSIYALDGENGDWWEVQTTVDAANLVATGSVDTASVVALVKEEAYEDFVTESVALEQRHFDSVRQFDTNASAGDIIWKRNDSLSPGGFTVVQDSVYYVREERDPKLLSVDRNTGQLNWGRTPTSGSVTLEEGSPTVHNGLITIGSSLNHHTFDAHTGTFRWDHHDVWNHYTGSANYNNSALFIPNPQRSPALAALDSRSGDVLWTSSLQSQYVPSPPVIEGGSVYAADSSNSRILSVDESTGRTEWTFEVPAEGIRSGLTVTEDSVFFSDIEGSLGTLYSLHADTGRLEWKTPELGIFRSTPTYHQGTLYAGTWGELLAMNASTGEVVWNFSEPASTVEASPTIAGDTVYFGSNDGHLYAVNATTGDEKWRIGLGGFIQASPIVANGTVFAASDEEKVVAIATDHNESSTDSRAKDGTLGHVGDRNPDCETDLDLRDSSGDGIPDAVAEANPPIPELLALEDENLTAPRIAIDPATVDTSGDGLSDAATLDVGCEVVEEDGERALEVWIEDAAHHPARIDTTGDGLTDREQLEGWQIYYSDSVHATEAYLATLQEADEVTPAVLEDAEVHLVNRTVRPSPLVNDSDLDGVPDVDERVRGTDPNSFDTTGDGVRDDQALDLDADPTLHDFQGPEVDIHQPTWRSGDVEWDPSLEPGSLPIEVKGDEYTVPASLFDPAGLDEARVIVDGDRKDTETLDGQSDSVLFTTTQSLSETSVDALTGATVVIEATDRNDQLTETVAIRQYGFYGEVAKGLGGHVGDPAIAKDLGTLAGVTSGAGGLAELVEQIYPNPLEFLGETLAQTATLIRNLDEFDQIVAAMADSYEAEQRAMNPYHPDEQEELYRSYREGWYTGKGAWMALEILVPGGQLSKAAKSSARLQRTLESLQDAGRLGRAVESLRGVASSASKGKRIASYHLARGLRGGLSIGEDGARRLVSYAPTTGVRHAAGKAWHRVDPRTARVAADGSGELDDQFRWATQYAIEEGDVPASQVDRAVAQIDDLSGTHKRNAKQLVADARGDGLRLIDDMDDASLQNVLQLDIERADELRGGFARAHSRDYASTDEISKFAERTNSLEGTDGLNTGPVKKATRANKQSDFAGAFREVRVADEIGASNIDRMSIKVGPKGVDGELDIKLRSGEVIEVKRSFGQRDVSVYNTFEKKLTAMREHDKTDLDGNTLTVRAEQVDNGERVREIAADWEETVETSDMWHEADVHIRVVEDSTGNVLKE